MKLITISGLDGSGKSTQIELLKAYLENQDEKVFYFHATQFSIGNKLLSRHSERSEESRDPSTDAQGDSVTKAGWLKIFLRKIALCIDLWRFKLLRNNLHNNGYDYILSDRYFYDTIINIAYLSHCHSERSGTKSKNLIKNDSGRSLDGIYTRATGARDDIFRPDTAIYLQATSETIMSRERVPDQGLEYLQKKKELYDRYAEIFEMKIIDGNRNKEEIFKEVKTLCQL